MTIAVSTTNCTEAGNAQDVYLSRELYGIKSLDVYTDTSNRLENCGYYEISGYRHAQSMTTRLCSHCR